MELTSIKTFNCGAALRNRSALPSPLFRQVGGERRAFREALIGADLGQFIATSARGVAMELFRLLPPAVALTLGEVLKMGLWPLNSC